MEGGASPFEGRSDRGRHEEAGDPTDVGAKQEPGDPTDVGAKYVKSRGRELGDPTDVDAKYPKSGGGVAQATPECGAATSTRLVSPMISSA